MLHQTARRLWKQALWMTKIKLVYTRITLNRFTTLYFFLALLNCVVLVILQGVTYQDNATAVNAIQGLLAGHPTNRSLPVFSDGVLMMCEDIPHTACVIVATAKPDNSIATREIDEIAARVGRKVDIQARQNLPLSPLKKGDEDSDDESGEESDDESDADSDDEDEDEGSSSGPPVNGTASDNGEAGPGTAGKIGRPLDGDPGNNGTNPQGKMSPSNILVDSKCTYVLRWLDDIFDDAKREDLVTLVFQLWSFSLAFATVLNESLPHLGASLASHILGTAWAAYRVSSTELLREEYMSLISAGACNGTDLLGDWWEIRKLHAIPVVVVSALTLLATGILSINLYKIYASQSFSRVGASPQIHRIYKLVLFLSVDLHLTGFFSIASTAIWIDKITHDTIRSMAEHLRFYLAAFAVFLVITLPWLYLGWVCVRRECRKRFWIFVVLSAVLLTILTLMFASPLYRFIFRTWPFFATMTVTSYILMVATILLAIWCRLNFGKGLAHFLQVTDALEGADFTPVYFAKDEKSDIEFAVRFDGGYQPPNTYVDKPEASHPSPKGVRGQSVYSEANGVPVMLSSTPPLFQEMSLAKYGRSDHLSMELGAGSEKVGYTSPQIPPQSATDSARSRVRENSRRLSSSSGSSHASNGSTRQGLPSNPRSNISTSNKF
ncbi:hypothetical protein BDZ94DRAFT_1275823 [Collybia nuda]|uniref:Uncharacterized protein n=1 Tax=Collybia nuda TaxID=64659 RepID=A0A9P5XT61_9AGAR|nr:hypothetical protein BDZ94DRAFT_1275823 [Collybia nuda]